MEQKDKRQAGPEDIAGKQDETSKYLIYDAQTGMAYRTTMPADGSMKDLVAKFIRWDMEGEQPETIEDYLAAATGTDKDAEAYMQDRGATVIQFTKIEEF